jgi:uncharacterized protein
MHPLIRDRRAKIAELCRRYHVRRLEVFGSAGRGSGFDAERSDVDFLVEFEQEAPPNYARIYFEFKDALERLVGRKVDLVTRSAIRNPYFLAGVERTREPIYGA